MAMIPEYTIQHRGHTWTVAGGQAADIAQHYREQGATVSATMQPESNIGGIPVSRLNQDQLENLNRIAEAEGWDQIGHMVRNEWQTRM